MLVDVRILKTIFLMKEYLMCQYSLCGVNVIKMVKCVAIIWQDATSPCQHRNYLILYLNT